MVDNFDSAPADAAKGKYEYTGFYNLREGGGLTVDGGRIRRGRLLRSDYPVALDAKALGFFRSLNLATVIDLRDPSESRFSSPLFQDAGFAVTEHPILSGSISSMVNGLPSLEQIYLSILQDSASQIADAIADVAEVVGSGAVLIHCTAGKDRTGLVVALIQSLLGARDADIASSYAATQANLSGKWLKGMRAKITQLASGDPRFADLDFSMIEPLVVGSPPEAIQMVLDWVRTKNGSAEAFLCNNGLTETQIGKLRNLLIEM